MTAANRLGSLTTEGALATIRFERRLKHRIEVVWAALTEPAHRAFWLGQTSIDPKLGGILDTVADGPPMPDAVRRFQGRILTWDPPHVFEHEWHQSIIGDTVVRYELTADGEETILKMTHSGFRLQDANGFIPGEHAYLDRLESHLENAPIPDWQRRYAEVRASYV